MANLETIISSLEEIKQRATSLDNKLNNELIQVGTADLTSLKNKMSESIQEIDNAISEIKSINTSLNEIENIVKGG